VYPLHCIHKHTVAHAKIKCCAKIETDKSSEDFALMFFFFALSYFHSKVKINEMGFEYVIKSQVRNNQVRSFKLK